MSDFSITIEISPVEARPIIAAVTAIQRGRHCSDYGDLILALGLIKIYLSDHIGFHAPDETCGMTEEQHAFLKSFNDAWEALKE